MDHLERVPAMVFSRDSRWLVTGSWDRTLRVRDLAAVTEDAGVLKAGLERDLGLGLGEALGSER
jgi:WD40 repeat protein